MARSYLKVYFDFDEKTDELSDIEKARLLLALYRYAKTGEKPILAGNERFLFSTFKGDIDRDIAAYNTKVANGNLGGRPAKEKPKETEQNRTEPKETETPKNKDKDKDKKNKNPITPFGFDEFWAVYPKHQDKQGAIKAFSKINPDAELLEKMISAVKVWKNSQQWTKDNGQFIPMPATWLNGHRWEDEAPKIVPIGKQVTAQQYAQREYSDEQINAFAKDLIQEARGT